MSGIHVRNEIPHDWEPHVELDSVSGIYVRDGIPSERHPHLE